MWISGMGALAATKRLTVSTATIRPVQHIIPSSFTVGAIGTVSAIVVTPNAATTASQYLVGDVVILAEVLPNGSSSKLVRGFVQSISGNTINVQITTRDAATNLNPAFAANGEITGQTRLPIAPPTADQAEVVVTAPPELIQAANNSSDPMTFVAQLLTETPLVYAGLRTATNQDIDLLNRLGQGLEDGDLLFLANEIDIGNQRFVSATPLRFVPTIEVKYTKAG